MKFDDGKHTQHKHILLKLRKLKLDIPIVGYLCLGCTVRIHAACMFIILGHLKAIRMHVVNITR